MQGRRPEDIFMVRMSCLFYRVFEAIAQWECGLTEVVDWIPRRRLWWHLLAAWRCFGADSEDSALDSWLTLFETDSKSIKQPIAMVPTPPNIVFFLCSECQCLVLHLAVRFFSACVRTKFNIFKFTRNCEDAWHWFAQLWTYANAWEGGYVRRTATGTMQPYWVAGLASGDDTFWASPCPSHIGKRTSLRSLQTVGVSVPHRNSNCAVV